MICQTCQHESGNIRYIPGIGERCHNCGDFSEAGGTKSTGLVTRQSSRIRLQQPQHAGDLVPPHTYDRGSKKWVPNPEFVKLYPDRAKDFHSNDELAAAHMPKLAKRSDSLREVVRKHKETMRKTVQHEGETVKGIKRVVGK